MANPSAHFSSQKGISEIAAGFLLDDCPPFLSIQGLRSWLSETVLWRAAELKKLPPFISKFGEEAQAKV